MIDQRANERILAALHKMLQLEHFSSLEEANAYLAAIKGERDLYESDPEAPLSRAQKMMYQAFAATDSPTKIRLAKQALKISPDCTDAYVLLAEQTAKTAEEARDLYQSGIDAAERVLDPALFEQHTGTLWNEVEAHPYLRALKGVGDAEWQLANLSHAIAVLQRALDLDSNDNLGARFTLLGALLEREDTIASRKLLRAFKDDDTACWAYGQALTEFLEQGNTRKTRATLQQALRKNMYFADYLLGFEPVPQSMPDFLEYGAESEAYLCYLQIGRAWLQHPKSLDWMEEVIDQLPVPF